MSMNLRLARNLPISTVQKKVWEGGGTQLEEVVWLIGISRQSIQSWMYRDGGISREYKDIQMNLIIPQDVSELAIYGPWKALAQCTN